MVQTKNPPLLEAGCVFEFRFLHTVSTSVQRRNNNDNHNNNCVNEGQYIYLIAIHEGDNPWRIYTLHFINQRTFYNFRSFADRTLPTGKGFSTMLHLSSR
jgi:hypothetical protein